VCVAFGVAQTQHWNLAAGRVPPTRGAQRDNNKKGILSDGSGTPPTFPALIPANKMGNLTAHLAAFYFFGFCQRIV
jgi:hypothetical protein